MVDKNTSKPAENLFGGSSSINQLTPRDAAVAFDQAMSTNVRTESGLLSPKDVLTKLINRAAFLRRQALHSHSDSQPHLESSKPTATTPEQVAISLINQYPELFAELKRVIVRQGQIRELKASLNQKYDQETADELLEIKIASAMANQEMSQDLFTVLSTEPGSPERENALFFMQTMNKLAELNGMLSTEFEAALKGARGQAGFMQLLDRAGFRVMVPDPKNSEEVARWDNNQQCDVAFYDPETNTLNITEVKSWGSYDVIDGEAQRKAQERVNKSPYDQPTAELHSEKRTTPEVILTEEVYPFLQPKGREQALMLRDMRQVLLDKETDPQKKQEMRNKLQTMTIRRLFVIIPNDLQLMDELGEINPVIAKDILNQIKNLPTKPEKR